MQLELSTLQGSPEWLSSHCHITFDGALQELRDLISVTSVHGGGKQELALNLCEGTVQQGPALGQWFSDERLEGYIMAHCEKGRNRTECSAFNSPGAEQQRKIGLEAIF